MASFHLKQPGGCFYNTVIKNYTILKGKKQDLIWAHQALPEPRLSADERVQHDTPYHPANYILAYHLLILKMQPYIDKPGCRNRKKDGHGTIPLTRI